MASVDVWFQPCRLTILFLLLTGQKKQPTLNAQRIGLWGTSFGGCHVFGAAVRDPEIKCIISQLAFADGEKSSPGR